MWHSVKNLLTDNNRQINELLYVQTKSLQKGAESRDNGCMYKKLRSNGDLFEHEKGTGMPVDCSDIDASHDEYCRIIDEQTDRQGS